MSDRQRLTWLWYSMPMLSVLTRIAKRIPRWKYSLSTSCFTFSRMPHRQPVTSTTSCLHTQREQRENNLH